MKVKKYIFFKYLAFDYFYNDDCRNKSTLVSSGSLPKKVCAVQIDGRDQTLALPMDGIQGQRELGTGAGGSGESTCGR